MRRSKEYRVVYAILDTLAVVRHLLVGWRQVPKILLASLIIQILNVAVIFFLINGMGAEVSMWQCLLIVPTVMLISLLPFSIAGWGLRESAMATGFSLIHAPAAASACRLGHVRSAHSAAVAAWRPVVVVITNGFSVETHSSRLCQFGSRVAQPHNFVTRDEC